MPRSHSLKIAAAKHNKPDDEQKKNVLAVSINF